LAALWYCPSVPETTPHARPSAVTRLVALAALGLVTSTTLGFFGPFHWFLELFEHFRVQYLALLVPVGLYLVLARRWLVGGVALGAATLNALLLAPLFGLMPALWRSEVEHVAVDEVHVRERLRVMTFNVNGHNRDTAAILAQIEAADADVVLILEAQEPLREVLARIEARDGDGAESAGGYTIFGPTRADLFGVLLLTRLPVVDWQVHELGPEGVPALEAHLEWSGGEMVFFGVHTHPPRSATLATLRNTEIEEIAAWARDHRDELVIVLGDFNATPWSSAMGSLRETTGLRDVTIGGGLNPTWSPGIWPLRIPIDHALVSPRLFPLSRRVGDFAGSDHRPLVFDLAIQ
jgi:endonuclease/exonuclease/phosphatase (EEP) superfamily protein YafD